MTEILDASTKLVDLIIFLEQTWSFGERSRNELCSLLVFDDHRKFQTNIFTIC